jgi:crossover junction endodeoxyribonuclease RuvC
MGKIILGIDPGTNILGYGLIEVSGSKISLKYVDILYLKNELDGHKKLELIFNKVSKIIKDYDPIAVAIEAPFFGKNAQSMLKLGRAQGVAIAASVHSGKTVYEYSAKKIKKSISGNGNASKQQVSAMACRLLNLAEAPAFFDETDALATALCHYLQQGIEIIPTKIYGSKKLKGWGSFIDNNENRIIK